VANNKPEVLIIGLDGASWVLLNRLCDEGYMPNLQKAREEGTPGVLLSTIPPTSPVAWTSFLTGVRPGKHRLYGFFISRNSYVGGPPGHLIGRPVNASDIGAIPLWQVMNRQGISVGLLNVPVTYPPRPIQGYIVGDELFTPDESSDYTYPLNLKARLLQAVPEFRVRPYRYAHRHPTFVSGVTHYTREQGKAALWLLREYPTDVAVIVFTGTDRVQHRFWKFLVPESPIYESPEAERLRPALMGFYQTLDDIIGRLLESSSPKAVFFVSDHGFTLSKRLFFLNRWLYEKGYLRFGTSFPNGVRERLVRAGFTQERVFGMLKRLDVLQLRDRIRGRGRHTLGLEVRHKLQETLAPKVDWTKTRAYGGRIGEPFVYINLKGREPSGTVEPGEEYEQLREMIRENLLNLRDPMTGERVMQHVFRREDLYPGPYMEEAPDLVYVFRDPSYYTLDAVQTRDIFQDDPARSGIHERPGFFLAYGSHIRPNVDLGEIYIWDVMPTVMYLLGLPIPRGIDGRVLEEVITPEYASKHPITFSEDLEPAQQAEIQYSAQEQAQIEERLKSLGYL